MTTDRDTLKAEAEAIREKLAHMAAYPFKYRCGEGDRLSDRLEVIMRELATA